MKVSEENTLKEEKKSITVKLFPGKLVLGQSLIEKFEHAKAMSATIKGFEEKK